MSAICPFCGLEYQQRRPGQKFCSQACSQQHNSERHREGYRKKRSFPVPRLYEKRCGECGSAFSTTASSAKYCSDGCRREAVNRKTRLRLRAKAVTA